MTDEVRSIRGESFGATADLYDRARPDYPATAITWLLGESPVRVVDLGAGTGILTRQLAALGHEVVAVEPDSAMLERLRVRAPGLEMHIGSAERIPLPDASVDAVLAGQAYHWFDRTRAPREIARVLRPGGVLGPIWNTWDDNDPWVAELIAIASLDTGPMSVVGDSGHALDFGRKFTDVEHCSFKHAKTYTVDTLLDLIRSTSPYRAHSESKQNKIDHAVRKFIVGDDVPLRKWEIPYRADAFRARNSGRRLPLRILRRVSRGTGKGVR